jgi:hypothetical protein
MERAVAMPGRLPESTWHTEAHANPVPSRRHTYKADMAEESDSDQREHELKPARLSDNKAKSA